MKFATCVSVFNEMTWLGRQSDEICLTVGWQDSQNQLSVLAGPLKVNI